MNTSEKFTIESFDLKGFWQENENCFKRFSTDKPRAALNMILCDHFLMNLIPMESTVRYYTDPAYALTVHKQANDVLEREIGIRYFSEDSYYYIKGAFEVQMGTKRIINEGNTPWLESEVEDIDDVKEIIKYAEKWDAKSMAIADDWLEAKENLRNDHGKRLLFAHGPNGPATVAGNMLGIMNTCMFMMEEPEVMDDFFSIIADKYIEFYEAAMLEDNGVIRRDSLGVNDDNCYIFPPAQYKRFCVPYLKKMFDAFAPLSEHLRRQHSDSAMGHLMVYLNDLGVNEVNLGPEIHPSEIREKIPKAVIHGQMPPAVLKNGTPREIASYVQRDFECIGKDGGLVESPAGVVQESTPLENIRAYMHAVHTLTRYN